MDVLLAAVLGVLVEEKSSGPPSKLTGCGRNLKASLLWGREGASERASTLVRAAARCIQDVGRCASSTTANRLQHFLEMVAKNVY